MKKFPQVLLLGNGINISNGALTWREFLEKLADKDKVELPEISTLPMPLQAILVSNNNLGKKLQKAAKEMIPIDPLKDDNKLLSMLLAIDFDEIFTTNYTYELEQACSPDLRISKNKLKNMHVNISSGKAEPKYLLKTCNKTDYHSKERRIWHIHGEARKPGSMILGHDYYGRQVSKIIRYLEDRKNAYQWYQKKGKDIKFNSWIDSFIMGDVYILGQGFDPSEIDLWWLLNRKNSEKAEHGRVYFFEPFKENQKEKIALLKCFDVKVENFKENDNAKEEEFVDYIEFYRKAIREIEEKVHNNMVMQK